MRIGVTGHNGRLGKVLSKWMHYEPCTLDNARDFDVIVHTAAFTDVDGAETNIRDCLYSNFIFTENLRQDTGAKIIYLSTDFIFDGRNGPYSEEDEPNPISVYGWSKWLGERCLAESDLVIRTTVLYDSHKPDFVTWLLKELEEKEFVWVSDRMITTPTNVWHLAEAITYLVNNPVGVPVINVAGSDLLSRHWFAQIIANVFGHDQNKLIPTLETKIGVAERPVNAGLRTSLAADLGVPIYSVRDGLELMRSENGLFSSG